MGDPGMKYQGGKSRCARDVANAILSRKGERTILQSPFMGGLSVELLLMRHFVFSSLSDVVPDLVMMWDSIYKGWDPPSDLTEEEYGNLKFSPPSALRGFAGFGGSFGGKWFGGYGRISERQAERNGGSRSCAQQVARVLRRESEILRKAVVNFDCRDYRDIPVLPDSVIYTDPPYAGTLQYGAAGKFDSDYFWKVARAWHDTGAMVFVSEECAPPGWQCIWSKNVAGSMDAKNRVRTEKLWMVRE